MPSEPEAAIRARTGGIPVSKLPPASLSSSDDDDAPLFVASAIPADRSANVALIAFALGGLFSVSLTLALPLLLGGTADPLGTRAHGVDPRLPTYLASWSAFHLLEFVVTAVWNPGKVMVSSFLLNNGRAYHIAHAIGITEHLLELALFPTFRLSAGGWPVYTAYAGLGLVLGGQLVRSLAMVHASRSFSHHIAYRKKDDHVLVKTGIYSYARHPSYAGFWWWAVGTQVLLGNPVATVAFAVFLWRWFFRRIGGEEQLLIRFFGQEYIEYRKSVLSGLPLLR